MPHLKGDTDDEKGIAAALTLVIVFFSSALISFCLAKPSNTGINVNES